MAKLTSALRNALATKEFSLPGERKYPIDTKNRARNALSRVAQHGTPEEKAIVRRKVHAKFPRIGKSRIKPHTGLSSVLAAIEKRR